MSESGKGAKSRGSCRLGCMVVLVVLMTGCAASPRANSSPVPLASKIVRHTTPRPGRGFPQTGDFYPLESKKLGETGGPDVRACLDANGNLTAPPVLVRSSGSVRLDEAGLRLAAAGSGHYEPATENGRPVAECFVYRIAFRL